MVKRSVGVVGGGLVGVCCALYLQRDGHRVVLLERDDIGGGASFGNAGIMSSGGCVPIGMPGLIWKVPRMLLDAHGPLVIRWRYMASIAPWLARLVRASSKERVEQISVAMASLLAEAETAFHELLGAQDYERFIRHMGLLFPYKSEAAFAGAAATRELRSRRGISFQVIDQRELRELEPTLSGDHVKGVFFPDARHTVDPHALTKHLASVFASQGGEIACTSIASVNIEESARPAITSDAGARQFERLVIAAGAWSKPLARAAGNRIPLDTERGYHAMLPAPGVSPRIPMISGDHQIAITPMSNGLRLTGTVEFAGLRAPADPSRVESMIRVAERLLPGLRREGATSWLGFRPSTPDSLPVIGPSSATPNVLFAFGHGHLGVTNAAVTGKIIADLVAERAPPLDIAPFRPDRFW
jgi:D-amino-acid dehydrogenase